jgi:hypothetical protein
MDSAHPGKLPSFERVHQVLLDNLSKSTKDKILPRFVGDTFEDIDRRYGELTNLSILSTGLVKVLST